MSFCPHSREMKNDRVLCLFACSLGLPYITAHSWTRHGQGELMLRTIFPTARFPGSPETSHWCLRDSYFMDSSTWAPEKHCSETTWVIKGNKIVPHIFILNSQGLLTWEVHLVSLLQRRLWLLTSRWPRDRDHSAAEGCQPPHPQARPQKPEKEKQNIRALQAPQ